MKKKLVQRFILISKFLLYGSLIQCLLLSFLMAAPSDAQEIRTVKEVKIKFDFEETSISEVFTAIESTTDFKFTYYDGVFNPHVKIKLDKSNKTVGDILLQISKETGLSFKQINNNIRIQKNANSGKIREIEIVIQGITVTGKVTSSEDESGLPGVNVIVKGTAHGTVTDVSGNYKLDVSDESTVLAN